MNTDIDIGVELYLDTQISIEDLTNQLAESLSSKKERTNVLSQQGTIYVLSNDEFDEKMRKDAEDGFLYYRYLLEIEPNEQLGKENAVDFVSMLLEHLWSQGYPAVASCDYEELLPNKGGYKSANVPKPQ